jgi:hypothetical protein
MPNYTVQKHLVNTAELQRTSRSPIREALKHRLLTECLEILELYPGIEGDEALAVLRRIRHA